MADADLERAQQRLRNALERAVALASNDLLGRAQRRAPIDEGTLRGSGHASDPVWRGSHVESVVSFNTPYAAVQHERLDYVHRTGGEAKYLEGPLKEMAPHYAAFLAGVVRREMGSM